MWAKVFATIAKAIVGAIAESIRVGLAERRAHVTAVKSGAQAERLAANEAALKGVENAKIIRNRARVDPEFRRRVHAAIEGRGPISR